MFLVLFAVMVIYNDGEDDSGAGEPPAISGYLHHSETWAAPALACV